MWTWGAFFLSCLFFVFMVRRDGRVNWTAAERLYLSDYLLGPLVPALWVDLLIPTDRIALRVIERRTPKELH